MLSFLLVIFRFFLIDFQFPVDTFGTVVGENPTPYGILALWAVNSLSNVYWVRIGRI